MATEVTPPVSTEGGAAPAAPASPSFSAVARGEESPTPPAAAPAAAVTPPAAAPKPFVFDEWYKAQPPEALQEVQSRFARFYDGELQKQYGDILPVVLEVAADPEMRKRLARLADKDTRAFALQNALDIYDKTVGERPAGEAPPHDPVLAERLERLEGERAQERADRQNAEYANWRIQEVQALINEIPALGWKSADEPTYKQMNHLIEVAHNRTLQNQRAGINRPVSVREVYDEFVGFTGKQPPPAAPATSRAETGFEKPQAPTNEVEGKERMLNTLKKAGGFRSLAEAASRRK